MGDALHRSSKFFWATFLVLWYIDAWLSIEFIEVDIYNEANVLYRSLIELSGTPNVLYLVKTVVAVFTTWVFVVAEGSKKGKMLLSGVALCGLMAYINYISYQMVF